MNNVEDILKSIQFEDIEPRAGERIGLHRVSTQHGCIDFVRLYEGTIYEPHFHD